MPVKQLSDKNADGTVLGQSASDKVSTYGVTPVIQASSITALTTTPTATDIATAVNAVITAIKNFGITA
jgi:hypothetical protein